MKIPETTTFSWVFDREPDQSVAKFLAYRKKDKSVTLYAGNSEFHSYLAGAGNLPEFRGGARFAAGAFDRAGNVLSWTSTGYNYDTPEAHHDLILRCIAENKAIIEKNWGKSV